MIGQARTSRVLRFRSASARVDLQGPDHHLGPCTAIGTAVDLVRAVGHAMLTDDAVSAERVLDLECGAAGAAMLDGTTLPLDPNHAAATMIAAVDRALLNSTPCLCIHAAALAGPRGAAIVPGASGAGKSTLAAAAMQCGLRLITDEAACVDPQVNVLWPHPRPLGLCGSSRTLLGLPAPADGPPEGERATAPNLLGPTVPTDEPVSVALVVLPMRVTARSGTGLSEVSQLDGLAALLGNCLNTGPAAAWTPEAAWARLGALMPGVRTVRMQFDTPQRGSLLLAQALA